MNKNLIYLSLTLILLLSITFYVNAVTTLPLYEQFENWNDNGWASHIANFGNYTIDSQSKKDILYGCNMTVTKYIDSHDYVYLNKSITSSDSIIFECDFKIPVNLNHFGESGRLTIMTIWDEIGERSIELCINKRSNITLFSVGSYYTSYNGVSIANKTITSNMWYKLRLQCQYINTNVTNGILLRFWINNTLYYHVLTGGSFSPMVNVDFGIHFIGANYLTQNMVFHYDNIYITTYEWDYTIFYIFILGFVVIIASCCYFAFQVKNGNFIKGMFFGVSGIAIGLIMVVMWLLT